MTQKETENYQFTMPSVKQVDREVCLCIHPCGITKLTTNYLIIVYRINTFFPLVSFIDILEICTGFVEKGSCVPECFFF